jgi:uncharacterized protein YdhG (YjbR/CyaY superfamily)
MTSKAKTVTEYMKEVTADHLDALTELREICLQTLRGFRESMEFGMPSYTRNNKIEVAWTSQKNFISIYFNNEQVFKKFKAELKGLDTGKSWIRFKKPRDLDFQLISKMLQDVVTTPYEVLV